MSNEGHKEISQYYRPTNNSHFRYGAPIILKNGATDWTTVGGIVLTSLAPVVMPKRY